MCSQPIAVWFSSKLQCTKPVETIWFREQYEVKKEEVEKKSKSWVWISAQFSQNSHFGPKTINFGHSCFDRNHQVVWNHELPSFVAFKFIFHWNAFCSRKICGDFNLPKRGIDFGPKRALRILGADSFLLLFSSNIAYPSQMCINPNRDDQQ